MSAKETGPSPVIVRLLQRSHPNAIDRPAVRSRMETYARACSEMLQKQASLETAVTLEELKQGEVKALLRQLPGTLLVSSFVPFWQARTGVRFDRSLIIRALDALYGGDPKKLTSRTPARALTSLERSLATRIGRGFVSELMSALGEGERADSTEERLIEPGEQLVLANPKLEYVAASLKLVDYDEQLTIAFPVSAIERLAEQLEASETQEEGVIDLDWTDQFRQNVEQSTVELTAKIEGPRLHLSDVADLKPGSLIEFDREFMRSVTLTAGDQPVFKGRLGQSRGHFTVMLSRPLAAAPPTDEKP